MPFRFRESPGFSYRRLRLVVARQFIIIHRVHPYRAVSLRIPIKRAAHIFDKDDTFRQLGERAEGVSACFEVAFAEIPKFNCVHMRQLNANHRKIKSRGEYNLVNFDYDIIVQRLRNQSDIFS